MSSYSFFWAFFLFIISIFVFHNICNISQQQTTRSYATGGSEQSETLTYYVHLFSSCRQARQHRQLWVNFSVLELFVRSLASAAAPPSHLAVGRPQARGERLAGILGRGPSSALPWGQREREKRRREGGPPRRGALRKNERKESGTMEARGTAERGEGSVTPWAGRAPPGL